jgi:Outer membrane protein
VATADIYPKFRLMGTIGLESISTGDFWESVSRTWSIGPGISLGIFHGGAIRQNIKVRSALQEQVLIQCESVVIDAQEEVENVLMAYARRIPRQGHGRRQTGRFAGHGSISGRAGGFQQRASLSTRCCPSRMNWHRARELSSPTWCVSTRPSAAAGNI